MKVFCHLNKKETYSLIKSLNSFNKSIFKFLSKITDKIGQKNENQTIDDNSSDLFIESLELDLNKNEDIFEDIKKKDNSIISKSKIEDKYEKVSNLKALQLANNTLIINAISRNRDIKRIISDKTDCSDDNYITLSEGVWSNNIEESKSANDVDEMDNDKIEELIEYVKNTKIQEITKFQIKELKEMSNNEYKKFIIEVLKFIQINIDRKYKNKANRKDIRNSESIKNINDELNKKFNYENRNIDQYFLEKQNHKRIIYGQDKKMNDKEFDEIINYLNEESKIDFRKVRDIDPDIISKFIPQNQKDRKKFKQNVDLKSEVILV